MPLLGERRLRRLARRAATNGEPPRRATVPLLVAGDVVVMDSWNIVRHADRHGQGQPLVPADREAAIAAWNRRSEEMLNSIRALGMIAIQASPAALDQAQPGFVPRFLRPLMRPTVRVAARFLARKHGVGSDDEAHHEALLQPHLQAMRDAIAALPADRPYLLGEPSYADVVMASTLQGIVPVADRYLELAPVEREVWTRPKLAAAWPDLLAWRDRVYERERRPSSDRA
jgi:glutathione S-transferase